MTDRVVGTVKWFNAAKGFGFIIPSDQGDDIFVHYTSITADGFRSLEEGQQVEYTLNVTDKGPQAQNVIVV
ncbi:MAG: cold shock domain-containing protein [Calditrichota bacterium]